MSIASLKSALSDIATKSNTNDGSIGKKLESISSNFKSTPTIIARDLKIEGNIFGTGFLEIEGNIKGTINGNSVVLREEGIIEGEVIAESLSLRGRFNGTIRAKNISITSKARVTGMIEYGSLSVEDGAFIDGQFKQLGKSSS
jgi:cytoskeletal protein CcmA (bactofilin family)